MHKIFGVVLLVAGVFLLIQGHDIARSIPSRFQDAFTGSPSTRITYYYLGGAICCAVGLVEFFRGDKK
jgi:ABC-type uncharacterized transport system permease subunit